MLFYCVASLTRIFHEAMSRDREDGRATGQSQGVGSEAHLNSTSQDPTPEDARKDGHIRGRSSRFVKYPGKLNMELKRRENEKRKATNRPLIGPHWQ